LQNNTGLTIEIDKYSQYLGPIYCTAQWGVFATVLTIEIGKIESVGPFLEQF
jgi:hypothetical protein